MIEKLTDINLTDKSTGSGLTGIKSGQGSTPDGTGWFQEVSSSIHTKDTEEAVHVNLVRRLIRYVHVQTTE